MALEGESDSRPRPTTDHGVPLLRGSDEYFSSPHDSLVAGHVWLLLKYYYQVEGSIEPLECSFNTVLWAIDISAALEALFMDHIPHNLVAFSIRPDAVSMVELG